MSDEYYKQQAARRTQTLLIIGGIMVIVVCVAAAGVGLFYDACTKSFDRSPEAVISAYLEAVQQGNLEVAQECWEHETYYDLEAGCSEVCLSRAAGAQYEVLDLTVGAPLGTPEGRANLQATVSLACTGDGEEHSAEIVLDSIGSNLPWRHWSIVHSTVGGTVAKQWCKGN